jgi:hypothetical protein
VLGKGAAGVVMRATYYGEDVAIKVISIYGLGASSAPEPIDDFSRGVLAEVMRIVV